MNKKMLWYIVLAVGGYLLYKKMQEQKLLAAAQAVNLAKSLPPIV